MYKRQQKEITAKTENLIEHLDEIDEEISAHTKAWNLERLGKAELSILRLATYEILLDEQVPRKVAINEAVELAKKYCNEKAAPFINGVLSKIGPVSYTHLSCHFFIIRSMDVFQIKKNKICMI